MKGWLVDTNVMSEFRKPRPDRNVLRWLHDAGTGRLFLSTISVSEIRFGIGLFMDPDLRLQLTAWLKDVVKPMFVNRILEVDEEILFEWRVLGYALNRRKRTVPEPDLLLSAVARYHRLVIVTRDVRHMRITGVPVVNPWTGERFNH